MKKTRIFSALAVLFSLIWLEGSALAAGYGDAGCGLGSAVWGNRSGFRQILAFTTNHTFSSQTLGITFGTSNCNRRGLVELNKEREVFAEKNYGSLTREMAAGKGETLETLAGLYGCPRENLPEFGDLVQQRFEHLVPNEATLPSDMLSSLDRELAESPLLHSCANITPPA